MANRFVDLAKRLPSFLLTAWHNVDGAPAAAERTLSCCCANRAQMSGRRLAARAFAAVARRSRERAGPNPLPVGGRRHKIEHIESIDPMDVPCLGALMLKLSSNPHRRVRPAPFGHSVGRAIRKCFPSTYKTSSRSVPRLVLQEALKRGIGFLLVSGSQAATPIRNASFPNW